VARVGQQTPLEVVALNAANRVVPNYTGTVHFTSTPSATLPADYTFTAADHGRHLFSLTPATAGTLAVTATDTTTSSITGNVSLLVDPAAVATHFFVVAPEHVQAGQTTPVLVAALDASNHVVPNYAGTVQITSSDGSAALPANYTFQAGDHGIHVFQVTFGTTGPQTVTATDTANKAITGSATVTVSPAAVATHFAVVTPENVQVGQATPVRVVALDASNHVVRNYAGTVQITSSDTKATLPANYTFQASDHGAHVFQVTFANTGSQTVTATDTANKAITGSATVTVSPAAVATHFAVLAPEHVQAGKATSVLVAALDASNHVVPNYAGTVQITSSDGSAALPANYTFQASDHGVHIFQVTFGSTGSQTVTAADTANKALTASATVLVGQPSTGTGGGTKPDDPDGSSQAQNDSLFASLPVWWWGARGR
jgi:cytochrome c oxidase assembly protein Cox11